MLKIYRRFIGEGYTPIADVKERNQCKKDCEKCVSSRWFDIIDLCNDMKISVTDTHELDRRRLIPSGLCTRYSKVVNGGFLEW